MTSIFTNNKIVHPFFIVVVFFVFTTMNIQTIQALRENQFKDLSPDADLRIGIKRKPKVCPRTTKKGDFIEVHYIGKLFKNLVTFDTSRERDVPFRFTLGVGDVIQGWDRGLIGMCIGERRKLVVPANLAYGEAGAQHDIKANATLIFYIELLNIYDDIPDDVEDYYGYGTNFWNAPDDLLDAERFE